MPRRFIRRSRAMHRSPYARNPVVSGIRYKAVSDAEIPYVYNACDHFGSSGVETSVEAIEILKWAAASGRYRDLEEYFSEDEVDEYDDGSDSDCPVKKCEDGKFLICTRCGRYFTTGDYSDLAVCPICSDEITGDSHDWTGEQWDYIQGESGADKNTLDPDWVKAVEDWYDLLEKKSGKLRKVSVINVARKALGV